MMQYRRRDFLHLAATAAASLPIVSRVAKAQSQAWPVKQIRAIVPVAPGSTIDIISRIVFEQLSRQLGQPIIIDNRAGAGTTIGSAVVARAEPDGYTLLVNSSAHAATPAIYPNAPYDTARDFAAVASLGSSPNVTVVAPEKGIKTLAELVAAAKARPGALIPLPEPIESRFLKSVARAI